jgi:DNA-binding NtrC family response regulator
MLAALKIPTHTIQHVLIVDDEEEFVKSLRRHLKRQGFRIQTACDGHDAVKKLAENAGSKNAFDLVVSDVVMPNMDGIQLLEAIKAQYPATSVILLTGFGDNRMAEGVIRKEMDEFYQKPIMPHQMLTLIQRIDRKRERRQTPSASRSETAGGEDPVTGIFELESRKEKF